MDNRGYDRLSLPVTQTSNELLFIPASVQRGRKESEAYLSPPACEKSEYRWLVGLAANFNSIKPVNYFVDLKGPDNKLIKGLVGLQKGQKGDVFSDETQTILCLKGPYSGYICTNPFGTEQKRLLSQHYGINVGSRDDVSVALRPLAPVPQGSVYLPDKGAIDSFLRTRSIDYSRENWLMEEIVTVLKEKGIDFDEEIFRNNVNRLKAFLDKQRTPQYA